MSVFAMLIIAWCFTLESEEAMSSITEGDPQIIHTNEVECYADNLEVASTCPEAVVAAEQRALDFCAMLDVDIALDKSWHWANGDSTVLKQLGIQAPHKKYERDLGADVSYSGGRHVTVQNSRSKK